MEGNEVPASGGVQEEVGTTKWGCTVGARTPTLIGRLLSRGGMWLTINGGESSWKGAGSFGVSIVPLLRASLAQED